jgi:hypothetical protein
MSITAWRRLFEGHGYDFITTEKSSTNGFFVDPNDFPQGFTSDLTKVDFGENAGDMNAAPKTRADSAGDMVLPMRDWRSQLDMIKDCNLVKI